MRRSFPPLVAYLAGCCLGRVAERDPPGTAGTPVPADVFAALSSACEACGVAPCLCAHGVAHAESFYARAVDAGHMAFSADVAAACITALGQAACPSLDDGKAPTFYPRPLPESCLALFEQSGTVALGGNCWARPPCQLGLFCGGGSCQRLPDTGSAVSLIGYGCDPAAAYEDLSGDCQPLLDASASCGASQWCQSGRCEGSCQPAVCPEP